MKVRRRPGRPAPRARRLLSLLLSLLVVGSAAPFAPAARAARQEETPAAPRAPKADAAEFVPGAALVRFRSEWEADAASASPAEVEVGPGATDAGPVRIISPELPGDGGADRIVTARFQRFDGSDIVPGLRVADLSTADRERTLATIAALNSRPDVLYAEPNYIWRAKAVPNDVRFAEQYAMQTISAPAAWDTTTGSRSVVVAVIDTGVNLQHQDLAGNAWVNPGETGTDAQGQNKATNGVDDDGNGYKDDVNGWDFSACPDNGSFTSPEFCGDNTVYDSASNDFHGTHVAGIIGAHGNNSAGVAGVNWQVSIMSLKVLNPVGETAHIIRAYNYVRMMRQRGVNVRVTNNSYGGPGFSQSALDAIKALNDSGILFVAAAGNDSRDNFSIEEFPSNYDAPNVIAVASTNQSDSLSGFSNFSSRLVSMGAPGSDILSTTPNNGYQLLGGTSMATPQVAGAAALVCSALPACRDGAAVNSGISVSNLRGALAFTGDRVGTLQNNTTTGRRLNVRAALNAALETDSVAPAQTTLSVASQSGRSLTLSFSAPGDDGFAGTAADYDLLFVNPALGVRVLMPTGVAPTAGGAQQSVTVDVPYRNLSGTVELVAYDERGNASTSSVPVNVQQNPSTDPYAVTQSAAEALSSGGTRLAIDGDDKYSSVQSLPFAFPFYGQQRTSLTVSSNGVLYFSTPARREGGDADDVPSSLASTQGQVMIAGLWDDLEISTALRSDAGVFVVQDANRVIFRWQATTFPTPTGPNTTRGVHPVNFEIELRADGRVVFRYGAGNQNLFPVVAVSGGEPSAYAVESHTSEAALKNLTNAPTVTFAPRTTSGPPPAAVQFNTASFAQSEAAGQALLSVTRSGDLQAAGSVTVRTVDNPAAVRCDDTATLPGVAFARCDYATTVETLSFAAGEASKTVAVPLVNDAHVEPNETVQIALSQPAGGLVLGSQTAMTLTIVSDDLAGAANPIDGPPHEFFVRQHYLDFLSREPEASGLQAWLGVLNNCPNVNNHVPDNAAAQCDRNTVSSAFFRSSEFEIKGGSVFRFYRVAFGRLPLYAEMIPDMRTVTGQTPEEVFAKKAAFAEQFAARPEFQTAFGQASGAQYVAALLDRYGLQSITTPDPAAPDGPAKVTLTRQQLIDQLASGALTRGRVLRAVADSDQVGAAERDRSFVAMQYFGYLRRDPDEAGFNSWMAYLATHPGDYYTMVNGFLYSGEYRLRFGRE